MDLTTDCPYATYISFGHVDKIIYIIVVFNNSMVDLASRRHPQMKSDTFPGRSLRIAALLSKG